MSQSTYTAKQYDSAVGNRHMVQYSMWPNCCNDCDFCLREEREFFSTEEQIYWVDRIRKNIHHIDWANHFAYGVSLLGGEIFYIKDEELKDHFRLLIDDIIDHVIIPCKDTAKFSFVSNALYNPAFLFEIIDKFKSRVGMQCVDANFSFDLKYRYANEAAMNLARDNINHFCERYNYSAGIQMIMTQYVIDLWKRGEFDVGEFMAKNFPKGNLCFLYPHPIYTGRALPDFNFKRKDLFIFLEYLKREHYMVYFNFINSVKNSCTFKYTGLEDKVENTDHNVQPTLSNGKEIIQSRCGHSVLYQCYSDSSRCLLCDLLAIDDNL